MTILILLTVSPQALSNMLQELWSSDVFPDFFTLPDPPEQHPVCVPGPLDVQIKHWI